MKLKKFEQQISLQQASDNYYIFSIENSEKFLSTEIQISKIIGDVSFFLSTDNENIYPDEEHNNYKKEEMYREANILFPIKQDQEGLLNYHITLRCSSPCYYQILAKTNAKESIELFLNEQNPIVYELNSSNTKPVFFNFVATAAYIELIPIEGKFELYLGFDEMDLTSEHYDQKSTSNFIKLKEALPKICKVLVKGIGDQNYKFSIELINQFSLLQEGEFNVIKSPNEHVVYIFPELSIDSTDLTLNFTSKHNTDAGTKKIEVYLNFVNKDDSFHSPTKDQHHFIFKGDLNFTINFKAKQYHKYCKFNILNNSHCNVVITTKQLRDNPLYLYLLTNNNPIEIYDGIPLETFLPKDLTSSKKFYFSRETLDNNFTIQGIFSASFSSKFTLYITGFNAKELANSQSTSWKFPNSTNYDLSFSNKLWTQGGSYQVDKELIQSKNKCLDDNDQCVFLLSLFNSLNSSNSDELLIMISSYPQPIEFNTQIITEIKESQYKYYQFNLLNDEVLFINLQNILSPNVVSIYLKLQDELKPMKDQLNSVIYSNQPSKQYKFAKGTYVFGVYSEEETSISFMVQCYQDQIMTLNEGLLTSYQLKKDQPLYFHYFHDFDEIAEQHYLKLLTLNFESQTTSNIDLYLKEQQNSQIMEDLPSKSNSQYQFENCIQTNNGIHYITINNFNKHLSIILSFISEKDTVFNFAILNFDSFLLLSGGQMLSDKLELPMKSNLYKFMSNQNSAKVINLVIYKGNLTLFLSQSQEKDSWVEYPIKSNKEIITFQSENFVKELFINITLQEFSQTCDYTFMISEKNSEKQLLPGKILYEELEQGQIQQYIIYQNQVNSNNKIQEILIELSNCNFMNDQVECLVPKIEIFQQRNGDKSFQKYTGNSTQINNFYIIQLISSIANIYQINITNNLTDTYSYSIMEQESNSHSETKLEERQEFIGSSSIYPNYYEIFFDDQLVNTMNMLFDISNCLGSLNIQYSFLFSDLLNENENATSLYESQSWRAFSSIQLQKNPLYVEIKSQPQIQLINWELLSHVFNYPFIKGESIFYAKRAHYPKNLKNPYDYFNFGDQKQVILFLIKDNNIEFSLNPLQCSNDYSYSGFKINKYTYTLNVWNDQSVLKYAMNCNPNIKNNKYKGYKYSQELTFDEHSKFFTKNSKLVFPKIALAKLKEKTFSDKFSQEKYFYASVKLTLSVKYDDKYFESIDEQMKQKYQELELVFNYSPNQIDVNSQKSSFSKFLKITLIILGIVTFFGLCFGFYFYRKAKRTLERNNLGLSDLSNLQKGLRPIENEMKITSGKEKYIEFKEE